MHAYSRRKSKTNRGHPFVRVGMSETLRGGRDSHAEGAMAVAELSRHPRQRSRCFSAL